MPPIAPKKCHSFVIFQALLRNDFAKQSYFCSHLSTHRLISFIEPYHADTHHLESVQSTPSRYT